jgi:ppGpp synthetase/RelA/SpoT-type nucleotidyltranferase
MYPDAVSERIRRLVDEHFPWGEARPESWEQRLTHVKGWVAQQTLPYGVVATVLIARIEGLLAGLQEQLPAHERGRFLYRIDERHVRKSPDSVLEKMARKWKDTQQPPPISFHNLDQLNDLGRFRIVTNFLSDAERICQLLEEPYDGSKRRQLSPHQEALRQEFGLRDNRFEDLIAMAPAERKTGERCRKAIFTPQARENRGFGVEVQILTLLQEAWDKRDHFLIYEQRRAGVQVDPEHERTCFSLSEQLYLADKLFDQIKQASAARRSGRTDGK